MKSSEKVKGIKEGKISALIGLVVNLVLGCIKITIGAITGSIAVTADGMNNLGDVLGSGSALAGFTLMSKPPSKRFPHGYGKAEYFSLMIVSLIMIFLGFSFVYSSFERIAYYRLPIYYTQLYFWILASTVPVKFALAFVYKHFNKRAKSNVIQLSVMDCFFDTAITVLTLVSYLLTKVTEFPADGILGIAISVYIITVGIVHLVRSARLLIGVSDKDLKLKTDIEQYLRKAAGFENAKVKIISHGERKKDILISGESEKCIVSHQDILYDLKNKFGYDFYFELLPD